MAEEIGSIEARITADTSDFTRGLLAAEAEAKAFAFDVNKVGTDTTEFGNALKYAEHASMDANKAIQDSARLIGDVEKALTPTNKNMSIFDRALVGLMGATSSVIPLITGFVGSLTTLGVTLGVVAIAVVALIDIMGTLIAIVGDAVAPVTLLVGLLGGLAGAFVLAAKRAADGGPHLDSFADKVDKLGSMFHRTTTILAQAFLPYLNELADAGEKALLFLDKIAKLPLEQAFHVIDTQGVNLLQQFVDRVAAVTARPIRLAFQVAFGDSNFANAVSDWWDRFKGFLFGYVQKSPIRLPTGRIIGFTSKQVDGIFQPLIDWFNDHDFTKQGHQIGHAILSGFTDSEASSRIGQALVEAFKDATVIVAKGFVSLLGHLRDRINAWGQNADHVVAQAFADAWHSVTSSAVHAFQAIADFARNIWNKIIAFITHPISINIDWPSPPSWLTDLVGGGGGPNNYRSPTNVKGGSNVAGAPQVAHFHLMLNERELGVAIVNLNRGVMRQNASRNLMQLSAGSAR